MDIPVELFITFIGISGFIAIFGFIRQPQIPAMLAFSGVFLLVIAVSTTNVIMGYAVGDLEPINNEFYNVLTSSTGITIRQDGSWIRGEFVTNSASQLSGEVVNCLTTQLSRNSNPDFNTPIIFAVFDTSANIKYEFGRMNVTETTSSIQFFQRCNDDSNYTIVPTDRIGIMWNDGDATNNIAIRIDNSDPFDSSNTQATAWNGAWTQTSGSDYSMTISFEDGGVQNTEPINFEFTELPKVLFALLGTIFILCGALMVTRN